MANELVSTRDRPHANHLSSLANFVVVIAADSGIIEWYTKPE